MKKSLARKVVRTGILAAGFLLLTGGAASAADLGTTGNYGAGNGNQAVAAWQSPITVCGNAAAAGGTSGAWCDGDATADITADALNNLWTSDNYGLLNGNQAAATVQAPITGCGNAASLLGASTAGCSGRADANLGKRNVTESAPVEAGRTYDLITYGNYGAGNGNQVAGIAQAPISVCGNAAAVGGTADAGCDGSVHAVSKPALTPNMYTSDNFGLLNGNQVGAGAQVPVTACGNSVAVLGATTAGCKGNASAQSGSDHDPASKVSATKAPAMSSASAGSLDSLTGLLG